MALREDIGEVERRPKKFMIASKRGSWCREGRRNGLGDGSDRAVRIKEASRVTSGLCLVLVTVPFVEIGDNW